jgi:chromosome segregation ATPase
MSIQIDTIQSLTEAATKFLGEIVSLKETCKQHEGTIAELNNKKAELALALNKSQNENSKLSEEVSHLHKELNSHEALVQKLEEENKELSAVVAKPQKAKPEKTSKAEKQN